MSGAIDAVSNIGLSDVLDFAPDIGSITDLAGTEFLSSFDITSFEVPSFDVASLGGFDIAGSFAGSASWFDTFNPGAILDSIPSVSDFNLPSLPSLPSLSSLNTNNLVSSAASSFGISPSLTSTITKTLSNPSLISAGASALGINPSIALSASKVLSGGSPVAAGAAALGINPSIVSSATNILNGGSPVAAGAAALGINPSIATSLTARTTSLFTTDPNSTNARDAATGLPINTPRQVDEFGLTILNAAQTAELTKNVNPAFINSLVDPSTNNVTNYDQALASRSELLPLANEYTVAIAIARDNIASNNDNIAAIEKELTDENLPDDRRQLLEEYLQANYENNAIQQNAIDKNTELLNGATENLAKDQTLITATNSTATQAPAAVSGQAVDQYAMVKNTDGTYAIFDRTTGNTVQTGLSEQQAILAQQDLNLATPGISLNTNVPILAAATTTITGVVPNTGEGAGATAQALTTQLRNQQAIRSLRSAATTSQDWRVRLKLAPGANYLYKLPPNQAGILAPLADTDGVIFPYTPAIETAYKANYNPYDLTHSNFRGYFYQGSYVDAVNVRATFTAQDTQEANYLLAVIHFFRSVTKMFYGQDAQRGSPPPLVYLSGLGDYQFAEHPCAVSQFNYTLPPDVDYIRAGTAIDDGTNFLANRVRTTIGSNPLSFAINRLLNNKLTQGAQDQRPNAYGNRPPVEIPTYVPTRIEMGITLLPIQSRQQVSTQFSVQGFGNGNLLKGGFW